MRLLITAFVFMSLAAPAWADAVVAPKCAQILIQNPAAEALLKQVAALKSRLDAVKNEVVRLGTGRQLTVQSIKPATASDPVLLLMPGVNRALLASDPTVTMLAAQGYGVMIFNLSPQPLSVATLAKNERPAFRDHKFELQDLANEVQALAERAKKDMGTDNVIPVSLSYTGAVSAHLKGFPLIFETVPMTSSAATNPKLEEYRQLLKSGEFFNPIFGPGITRNMLDTAYRQQWSQQVETMTKQFNLPKERRDDMIEGYTVLSRATEGFAWNLKDLSPGTRRVFLLAGNEAPPLLRHQIDTFEALLKTREDALAFLVLETGHVIPSERPEIYSAALKMVTSGSLPMKSGLVVIQPSTNETKMFPGAQAIEVLNKIREQLGK
ncbi:MAG: hypothetical protein KF681_07115 [Bdellovibrionaceae bacterium]|nr:hypothetical protein [Pseudobdellovibrionaceae bacterium]